MKNSIRKALEKCQLVGVGRTLVRRKVSHADRYAARSAMRISRPQGSTRRTKVRPTSPVGNYSDVT